MTSASGENPFAASDLRVVVPQNLYRVIVTGWRHWPLADRWFIWRELDGLWTRVSTDMGEYIPRESIVIVHGQCPYGGVDLHAESWARVRRQLWEPYPADFEKLGRAAGPRRNAEMVALGADLCIGFPGPKSRGTWDCLEKATNAGIENYSRSWFPNIEKRRTHGF